MSKVIKCDRCGKRMRNAEGWNVEYKAGRVAGNLCPECQTPEENMEAAINEATVDYNKKTTVLGLTEDAVMDLLQRSEIDPEEYNIPGLVHAVNQAMVDELNKGVPVDEPTVGKSRLMNLTIEQLENFHRA